MKRKIFTIGLSVLIILFANIDSFGQLLTKKELKSQMYYSGLKNALKNPGEVYVLSIGKKDYDEFIKNIDLFHNVQDLTIHHVGFSEVPKEIYKLKYIQILGLSGNNITDIGDNILELKHLRVIGLNGNPLSSVPESVAKLENLEEIRLADCPNLDLEKTFDILRISKNLKHFSFGAQGVNVEHLPENIKNLSKLESFSIGFAGTINYVSIFNALANVPTLKKLYIQGCYGPDTLADEIRKLKGLTELMISSCGLKHLSDGFYTLKNLDRVDFSMNKIESISSDIKNLTSLRIASFSLNNLKDIPMEFSELKNLRKLYLDDNYIDEKSVDKLKKLMPNTKIDSGNVNRMPPK